MVKLLEEMRPDALELPEPDSYSEAQLDWIKLHLGISKQYYQSTYVFNLLTHSSVRSHCLNWLLGDPKDIDLQNACSEPGNHQDTCENCELIPKLFMILMAICRKIEQNNMHDTLRIQKWTKRILEAEEGVLHYRNFIIRNKVSELDWGSFLSTDEPEKAQVTYDFAMDHLPEGPT